METDICKEGLLIRDSSSGDSLSTISVSDLGQEIRNYLEDHSYDSYLPLPKSASPDLFIIPKIVKHIGNLQDEKDTKIVIGVQVKCFAQPNSNSLGRQNAIAEALKFEKVLREIRNGYSKKVKGVFIMCGTCKYTQRDFAALNNGRESILWQHDSTDLGDMEIVIINLSTAELRKEFFGMALAENVRNSTPAGAEAIEDARMRVSAIIESVISMDRTF
jgi:hypothetical protein